MTKTQLENELELLHNLIEKRANAITRIIDKQINSLWSLNRIRIHIAKMFVEKYGNDIRDKIDNSSDFREDLIKRISAKIYLYRIGSENKENQKEEDTLEYITEKITQDVIRRIESKQRE